MIKKIFKIIGISLLIGILGLMIIGTIANIVLIPSKEKIKVDQEMYATMNRINSECPIHVGANFCLTKVCFNCDTICYDYELRDDTETEKYYSENSEILKKLTTFLFVVNEHYGWNSKWATLINKYDYVWKQRIKICDENFITAEFNGNELNSALKDITSDEALQSYLDATLFLVNQETPIIIDEDGNQLSNIQVSKDNYIELSKKYQLLKSLSLNDRDVICEFSIPEVLYSSTILDFKEINKSPETVELFLKEMCTDLEFKDFLKIFAFAKCNLVFRYYGVKSKELVEIKIPYSMIRHHTYIPPELLEE